ncbi:unnamed protein product [Parnassius mnemosyne]|uniref:Uncharacterized protein n=1 Tax=Parnassius mnemosyne TaxID=213953 RepID=A0AAV1LBH3_9NEOP
MTKTLNEGTFKELLEIFNKGIKAFKRHVFNFYYQYNQYKLCRENLKEYEAIIHIDFSENYICKFHQEVQAKHFVKDQITLHTGVLYIKDQSPESFCSISLDNQHNPESIWAHLDPVLNYIKTTYTNVNTIHFFSDGPTTQYRQKKKFYLFTQNIYDYGFSHSTWSFFEAAHGKGAADGVGGAIKRTLDMKTAQGLDIPDAQAAYDALSSTETTIKFFYVPAETIKSLDPSIVYNLTSLPGTMKIHQLITCGKYKLKYRDLSCFCENASGNCECHFPIYYDFAESISNKTQKQCNLKRINNIVTNKNTKNNLQKKKRLIRKSLSLSSESDTDIEFAESDASDVLSDVSRNTYLDYFDEITHVDYFDAKSGSNHFHKYIDPKKKINVLSNVIIQKPFRISNNYVETQYVTKTDQKTPTKDLEDVQQEYNTTEILDINKVTPLSEIKHSEENKAHLNLRLSKIFFAEERKINHANKENNAIPSTSKTSSEVCTIDYTDREFIIGYPVNTEQPIQIHHIQNNFNENETHTNENQMAKTPDDCKIKIVEKTSAIEKETGDDSKNIKTNFKEANAQEVMGLEVDASVIVRYYQRKQWKYYIGFIIQVLNKDNESFYKIRFLKTVKIPNLKFIMLKKPEIDIVPINSIVKCVNLTSRGEAKEYFLKEEFDYVYFT